MVCTSIGHRHSIYKNRPYLLHGLKYYQNIFSQNRLNDPHHPICIQVEFQIDLALAVAPCIWEDLNVQIKDLEDNR